MLDRTERQKLGVKKWIENSCKGSFAWATGVGKTNGAIMAIKAYLSKNTNTKIVVIVPTEVLSIQWMKALRRENLHYKVTVEIINTAAKQKHKVDFIVLDECHRYAAEQFYDIFNNRRPSIVLGLSATFDRLDGKHKLLEQYCPVCDVIEIKEAIENNWLSEYREYMVLIDAPDIEDYRQMNKRFQNAFSFFNHSFEDAMRCVAGIKKRGRVEVPAARVRYAYAKQICGYTPNTPKFKEVVAEVTAMTFEFNRAMQDRKAFVMNHPKKIEIARRILAYRTSSKAITFSATIKQAEKIGGGYVVHSKKTAKRNRLTLEEFQDLKVGVLHTSKKLDEGADIPGLNLGIILCNSSSATQKTQRIN